MQWMPKQDPQMMKMKENPVVEADSSAKEHKCSALKETNHFRLFSGSYDCL